jgi:hypothetical protein
VSFGSNDYAEGGTDFAGDINQYMTCVDPSTMVYWLPPTSVPDFVAILEVAAAQWTNLELLPFYPTDAELKGDGIHFTNKAKKRLARMIRNIVVVE